MRHTDQSQNGLGSCKFDWGRRGIGEHWLAASELERRSIYGWLESQK